MNDPVVNFRQDLGYSCSKKLSISELKTYCEGASEIKNLQIFKNLEELKKFGRFGNANLLNKLDWQDVTIHTSYADLGKATWNEESSSCTLKSSALVKIIYSETGFTENPQKYVVGVELSAVDDEWTFPSSSSLLSSETLKRDFSHLVQVQFVELQNSNEDETGYMAPMTS